MELTVSSTSLFSFFTVLLVGAMVPTTSGLIVSARAAGGGIGRGLATALGVVLGDMLRILLVLWALTLLAGITGEHFRLLRMLAGLYLIGMGGLLVRSGLTSKRGPEESPPSKTSGFVAGVLIPLADQKATLFYLGILPLIFDVPSLSWGDIGLILVVAACAISLAKGLYAFVGDRIGALLKPSAVSRGINLLAGALMIAGGGYLLIVESPLHHF